MNVLELHTCICVLVLHTLVVISFTVFILNTWEKQKHKHATCNWDMQKTHTHTHTHVFSTCPSLQHLNTQAPDPFRSSGEAAQDECSVGSVGEEGLWINSIHFVLDANFPLSTLVFISFCFKEYFSCILMFTFMFHVSFWYTLRISPIFLVKPWLCQESVAYPPSQETMEQVRDCFFRRVGHGGVRWYPVVSSGIPHHLNHKRDSVGVYGCWTKNRGVFPPKSSILIGFSIIFTIHFGGTPIFGNIHSVALEHGITVWRPNPEIQNSITGLKVTPGSSNIAIAGKWTRNEDVFTIKNGGYSSQPC